MPSRKELSIERRNESASSSGCMYLQGAAEALKAQPANPVHTALTSLTGAEDQKKENRWREKLEESRMHKDLGQLLPVYQ